MRRLLLAIGPLALGLCLLAASFFYFVLYAGIPYQDPTPELQAQYNLHASIASHIESAGAVLALAGFVWLMWCIIRSFWRGRSRA